MVMKFGEHDQIVTAYAQRAAGPGWANQPIWVVVRSRINGEIRLECLQPEDSSKDILSLYDVSQAVHRAMTDAVKSCLEKSKRPK